MISRRPEGTKRLRVAVVGLLLVGAVIGAVAAVIGKLPGGPAWVGAGAAGLAALAAALLPQVVGALKTKQQQEETRQEATARLMSHLTSLEKRYLEHMKSGESWSAGHNDSRNGVLLERLVRVSERFATLGNEAEPRVTVVTSEGVGSAKAPPAAAAARTGPPQIGPLNDFIEPLGGPLVVLGEGGSGKTTLLLKLAVEAADRAAEDPAAPIPVYIELKNFSASENGFDRLFGLAANSIQGMDVQEFDALWRRGSRHLLLLIDGFNEQRGDMQEEPRKPVVWMTATFNQRGHKTEQRTMREWVNAVRKKGYLTPGRRGLPGGAPGPELIKRRQEQTRMRTQRGKE